MTQAIGPEVLQTQPPEPHTLGSRLMRGWVGANCSDQGKPGSHTVGEDRTDAILSALLIIGVPTIFWMGIIEIASAACGFGYGIVERLVIGSMLVAFLTIIRGCAREAGRA